MQLQIGDKTADGSVVVRDEDRLCYQVYSTAKGVTGLRTISKALLDEWVSEVQAHPSYTSDQLRKALSGKTEIDKFEYGYASTLKKMAEMVLGIAPVIHAAPDFSEEFCKWFAANRGKGSDTTAKKYLAYFKTLTDAHQEPTHSYWHGLYKVMYGHDAEKEVAAIGELNEFEKIYGAILPALEKKNVTGDLDPVGSQKAIDWFWQPEVKPHTCVTSALKAYRDFLKWRNARNVNKSEVSASCSLVAVLRLFAKMRYESEWQTKVTKDSYLNAYTWGKGKIGDIGAMTVDEFREGPLGQVWAFQNGGSRKWGQLDEGEKTAYRDFVAEIQKGLKPLGAYFPTDKKCPRGIGVGVVTELLMRFYPESCCSYNDALIWDGLVALGLAGAVRDGARALLGGSRSDFAWPKTPAVYQEFMGVCAHIQQMMSEMDFGRTPVEGDKDEPNYITVNEFLWWAHENKDLIKEKVMSQKLKTINSKDRVKNGSRTLADAFKDDMMKRLAAALRTKPFAILAGHSGTGKSQLVRRLAYMTCNNEDLIKEGEGKTASGNYCMVQVKPNWHDSTDLLGYYTDLGGRHFVTTPFVQFLCKAYAYPQTPFFLCLDEMNLAPVEQYFAEYLSAVESLEKKGDDWLSDPLVEVSNTDEKIDIIGQIMQGAQSQEAFDWIKAHGLTIPKNLFVVGTVNMDETTCQFSRKVLDRAMTLLMEEAKFADMNKTPELSAEGRLDEKGIEFFIKGGRRGFVGSTEAGLLDKVNESLANTPFVIAYRFANEYALYEEALANLNGVEVPAEDADETAKTNYRAEVTKCAEDALDQVVLMKLLPRIHGMKDVVKGIFEGRKIGDKSIEGLSKRVKEGGLSASKMAEITKRGDEYLTFWP